LFRILEKRKKKIRKELKKVRRRKERCKKEVKGKNW